MGSTCMGSALFGRQYFHTASTRSTTVYSLNTPSILLSIYEYDVYWGEHPCLLLLLLCAGQRVLLWVLDAKKNPSSANCIRRERPGRTFPDCLYYKEVVWQLRCPAGMPIRNKQCVEQTAVWGKYIYAAFCIQPSAIQSLRRDWERRPRSQHQMWRNLTNETENNWT